MTENTKNGGGWSGGRSRMAAWSAAALLFLMPWFAMQVSDQVVWDGVDFAIFGVLLVGVGVAFELAVRKSGNTSYRFAAAVALATAFILIAVNLAVGVIGTEHTDANMMFAGVLGVGFIGSVIARFKSHGLAGAMIATALAQVLLAVIALIAGSGSEGPIWPLDVLGLTGFFAAMWILSAWLFRKSAREQDNAID